ncbi:MAG: chemotaxis protein CheD [Polyangiales bacterium]
MSFSSSPLVSPQLVTKHVGIGELELAHGASLLQANLGSCLGIAVIWPEKGVCALSHVLLPHKNEKTDLRFSRYANTAVAHLIRRMKVPRDDVQHLSAIIAGGAAMFERNRGVGAQNIKEGLQALREARVRLIARDVGGEVGRRLLIDCHALKVSSIRLLKNETEEQEWTIRPRRKR